MKKDFKIKRQKSIQSGYSYEYVTTLQDIETRIKEFNIMRRSDSQIGAILRALKLPIRSAEWKIEGGKQEINDFVSNNLFETISTSFNDFLRWALSALDFGFSVFEKVFQYDENSRYIQWKKFVFLPQSTIYQIKAQKDGGLKEVIQYPAEPEGMVAETGYIRIPVDYVLIFSFEREGDWYGTSVLRNAYGDWKIKDSLVKIDAIKHDRFGVGVPYMKLSPNYDDRDVLLAKSILSKMRSHEYGFMIVPPNVEEFGMLDLKTSSTDVIASIRYHDEAMAKSVLSQFIDLGTSNSGNRALGQSFIELFLMSLNSIADFIAETFSKYAIKQLVDINFGQQEEYPQLSHSKVDIQNITELLKLLAVLHKNQAITLSPEDQNLIKSQLGFNVETTTEEKAAEPIKTTKLTEPTNFKFFRELAPVESRINWQLYKEDLDTLKQQYINEIKKYRDKQIKSLVYDIVHQEKEPKKVKPRYADMYEKITKEYQLKAFDIGQKQVQSEKKVQLTEKGVTDIKLYEIKDIPQDVLDDININAQIASEVLSNRTKAYITELFIRYKNQGLSNKEIAGRIYQDTIGKGDKIIAEEFNKVQSMWSTGRTEAAKIDRDIKGGWYSALMDENVCENCRAADEKFNAYHAKAFPIDVLPPVPNPNCDGGNRCRCIHIYEY